MHAEGTELISKARAEEREVARQNIDRREQQFSEREQQIAAEQKRLRDLALTQQTVAQRTALAGLQAGLDNEHARLMEQQKLKLKLQPVILLRLHRKIKY